MSENPLITLEQMDEAWADIRGYTSNMWQVAALCLTVVILSVNVFVTTLGAEVSLLSFAWIPVLTFAFCFVVITVYTIQWFRYATVQRVIFLVKVEEKLKKSAPDSLISLRELFGVEWGPLKPVLLFFYGLAVSLLSIVEVALFYLGMTFHLLFLFIALAGIVAATVGVFLPLIRQYKRILAKEDDAWTLSDVTKFDWEGVHFPVLKDISVQVIEMLRGTMRGQRINYMKRTQDYVESAHGARLSEGTIRKLFLEDGPIHKMGLDPRANEWRKQKNKAKAFEELDKIAEKISKLEAMPK
ncbi:MAG: hypothetical protein ThorAB25_23160 [Candidatus Thorarchaeota archaeon AB_25]|nr:MAG: hypothetical protein ThorAB25_23160 [Candidatus Thorarchaeota archaeon AB_25]